METYPIDADPVQVVRWLKAECEATPSVFRIDARRTREVREIPVRREDHIGDEEREDLTEIASMATLEIAPANESDGWLLRIVVEDEVGPRISVGDVAAEGEQRIDLGTFYNEFIRPERGNAYVVCEIEGAAARARVAHLLNAIETNRHATSEARQDAKRRPQR
jgi:hypothetical protein